MEPSNKKPSCNFDSVEDLLHKGKHVQEAETRKITSLKTRVSRSNRAGKPKEKRRNNDKRKEKSRDAARCRRSHETEIFSELSQHLPVKLCASNQLDKASIMRITIAYLKLQDILQLLFSGTTGDNRSQNKDYQNLTITKFRYNLYSDETTNSKIFLNALDGFLIIVTVDGDITYVSENVAGYLGTSKIDMLGQLIWEYSHQCDHAELREILNDKHHQENVKYTLTRSHIYIYERDVLTRFKCTLTNRGRNINIKSASYKVIRLNGILIANKRGKNVLIAIGRPIPHPSNIEIPLDSNTFITKHMLDMKFTYVDDKMLPIFGYAPDDILTKSFYEFHHGNDSEYIMATFEKVINKGQGETRSYRFLGKYGGYRWVVTQVTVVYEKLKPLNIVCVNYVTSNFERENEIYSLKQLEAANQRKLKQEQADAEEDYSQQKNIEIKQEIKTEDIFEKEYKSEILRDSPHPTVDIKTLIPQKNPSQDPYAGEKNNPTEIKTETTPSIKLEELVVPETVIRAESVEIRKLQVINVIKEEYQLNSATTSGEVAQSNKTSIFKELISSVKTEDPEESPQDVIKKEFLDHPCEQETKVKFELNVIGKEIFEESEAEVDACTSTTNLFAGALTENVSSLGTESQEFIACINTENSGYSDGRSITRADKTEYLEGKINVIPNQQNQAMHKILSSFENDQSTMIKEDQSGISQHLSAIECNDTCMSLDDSSGFFGDIFSNDIFSCEDLLASGVSSINSTQSSIDGTHLTHGSYWTRAFDTSKTVSSGCRDVKFSTISQDSATNKHNGHNSNNSSYKNTDMFRSYNEQSRSRNCSSVVGPKTPDSAGLLPLRHDSDFALITIDDDVEKLSSYVPFIPIQVRPDGNVVNRDSMWGAGASVRMEKCIEVGKPQNSLNSGGKAELEQHTSFDSLSPSPASTESSCVSLPLSSEMQQQVLQSTSLYTEDTNELAALLCCSSDASLTALNNDGYSKQNTEHYQDIIDIVKQRQLSRSLKSIQSNFKIEQTQNKCRSKAMKQESKNHCGKHTFENDIIDESEDLGALPICGPNSDDDLHKNSMNIDCWTDLLNVDDITYENPSIETEGSSKKVIATSNSETSVSSRQIEVEYIDDFQQEIGNQLKSREMSLPACTPNVQLIEDSASQLQLVQSALEAQKQQEQNEPKNHHTSKRQMHNKISIVNFFSDSKRLKSSSLNIDPLSAGTPQLLQQLMNRKSHKKIKYEVGSHNDFFGKCAVPDVKFTDCENRLHNEFRNVKEYQSGKTNPMISGDIDHFSRLLPPITATDSRASNHVFAVSQSKAHTNLLLSASSSSDEGYLYGGVIYRGNSLSSAVSNCNELVTNLP